jgi:hypothetical protein
MASAKTRPLRARKQFFEWNEEISMKKLLISVVAIGVLMAVAGSASAVTCTIDQHPAATLLVPYFRAAFNADGSPVVGTDSYDTLITITNNSSAAMLAHVVVWNERSVPVLDFDIALTAYDSQSMSMQQVLLGNLPATPRTTTGSLFSASTYGGNRGACQTSATTVNVGADGSGGSNTTNNNYVRFVPTNPPTNGDNQFTTTNYPQPAWSAGSAFAKALLDELDDDASLCAGGNTGDGVVTGTVHGYVTIDHVNYCTLSFPSAPSYYGQDAIGQENNLTGEVLFTTGSGIGTNGTSTVNIEADPIHGSSPSGNRPPIRTFYARYWESFDGTTTTVGDGTGPGTLAGGETVNDTACFGDCREPLGLRTESRYFIATGITTWDYVWRGSSNDELGPSSTGLINLTGEKCAETENPISATLVDENEGQVSGGVTPSPPPPGTTSNFPLETGRYQIPGDAGLSAPSGSVAGVAYYSFLENLPDGWADQAWVEYEFDGASAFVSARIPANQMDGGAVAGIGGPFGYSNCTPVGFIDLNNATYGTYAIPFPFGFVPPNQAIGLP